MTIITGLNFSNPPSGSTYFFSDPLWDGSGCSDDNECCSIIKINLGFIVNWAIALQMTLKQGCVLVSLHTYAAGAVVLNQLELYISSKLATFDMVELVLY